MTVTVCEAAFRSAIRQLNIEICYRPWSFAAFLLRDSLDAGSYLLLRGEPRFGASLATKTAGRIDRNLGHSGHVDSVAPLLLFPSKLCDEQVKTKVEWAPDASCGFRKNAN